MFSLPPALLKLFTFAPAAGLVGLALYHAVNEHDLSAAVKSLGEAAAIVGIGGTVHATHTAVK
jgi:hypothetical protein